MTNGQLIEILTKRAIEWTKTSIESMQRNSHMNEIDTVGTIDRKIVEAAVVDYINFVAAKQCGMDLAFYTGDLRAKDAQ